MCKYYCGAKPNCICGLSKMRKLRYGNTTLFGFLQTRNPYRPYTASQPPSVQSPRTVYVCNEVECVRCINVAALTRSCLLAESNSDYYLTSFSDIILISTENAAKICLF